MLIWPAALQPLSHFSCRELFLRSLFWLQSLTLRTRPTVVLLLLCQRIASVLRAGTLGALPFMC